MGTRCVLHRTIAIVAMAAGAGLVACGGSDSTPAPYAQYAQKCASPPAGSGDQQGTVTDEKNWLRAWTDDLYLWYHDVDARTDIDPAAYATAADYFNVLKTPLKTPSGNDKDRFHFLMSTAEWNAFSQSGVTLSYGVEFVILAASPPRDLRIGYVGANSPGANAGLARGMQVVAIDDVAVLDGNKDVLNAGLGPTATNPTHKFQVQAPGGSPITVTMTAVNFTENPVPVVQVFPGTAPGTSVGYVLFNDHIQTAEDGLVQAFRTLNRPNPVNELILDMRYNGGGFVTIASELAYMISGPSTGGRTFEMLSFNDKHPTVDPVQGRVIAPTPFLTVSQGYTSTPVFLPTLGLKRVFVLTGPGTCSASEAVMNALSGVGVDVVEIGATTCGKPYGFYATDNCGTTYFSIQFKGVNAKGFGDYTDGFVPGGTGAGVAGMPGCAVAEDFSHQLGDPNDARVVAAMNWAAAAPPGSPGTCPAGSVAAAAQQRTALRAAFASPDAITAKPPWRENRIMPAYRSPASPVAR